MSGGSHARENAFAGSAADPLQSKIADFEKNKPDFFPGFLLQSKRDFRKIHIPFKRGGNMFAIPGGVR